MGRHRKKKPALPPLLHSTLLQQKLIFTKVTYHCLYANLHLGFFFQKSSMQLSVRMYGLALNVTIKAECICFVLVATLSTMQPVVDIALFSRMARAHCSAVRSLLWLRQAQALPRPHVPHRRGREKAPRQLPTCVGIGGVCANPPEVTGASVCPLCGDKEHCGRGNALLPASRADGRENIDLVVDEMGKGPWR